MKETDVGSKLSKNSPGLIWRPIADKFGTGIPDRLVKRRSGSEACVVELKALEALPARHCKLGKFQGKQANWLNDWKRDGGICFLIIGVGYEQVAIFDSGFIEICRDGLDREQFVLVRYDQVENLIYQKAGWNK